jgi:hypothetical protein
MNIFGTLNTMIFPLKRILAFMPGSILVAFSDIEIEREDENGLVLNADGWLVAFDKVSQTVSYSGQPVASFSSVVSIEVKHFVNGKRFEWWVLSLNLLGGKKLSIGRSTDGTQVSIVAAHASTITGKNVRATEAVGF